ncbi:MAG: hypothetical protein Q7R39_19760 [Dehalococcoidia bacterium]|nr:hypothetical protein [Dehalococcoidia bacterium]
MARSRSLCQLKFSARHERRRERRRASGGLAGGLGFIDGGISFLLLGAAAAATGVFVWKNPESKLLPEPVKKLASSTKLKVKMALYPNSIPVVQPPNAPPDAPKSVPVTVPPPLDWLPGEEVGVHLTRLKVQKAVYFATDDLASAQLALGLAISVQAAALAAAALTVGVGSVAVAAAGAALSNAIVDLKQADDTLNRAMAEWERVAGLNAKEIAAFWQSVAPKQVGAGKDVPGWLSQSFRKL